MIEVEVLTTQNRPLAKISIEPTVTVEEIKAEIRKQNIKLNVNRQSVRLQIKGKDQKNSSTASDLGLQNGSKLYVKDLGPQISWRAVFVLEYLGPLVLYAFVASRPWIFYGDKLSMEFSTTAKIAFGCWTFHYTKRLLETLFVHRFSHGTMPFRNLFKNCGYYWGFATYVAYHINHPLYTPPCVAQSVVGLVLFIISELGNLSIHLLLRDLRPSGSTIRKIPIANSNPLTVLYNYVSCPNYTYEFVAWASFTILTNCLPAFIFALAGLYQMTLWALQKHRTYKKEFSGYPKGRKAIIPFVI